MKILKITKKDVKANEKRMLATAEDVNIQIEDNYTYVNEYYLGISNLFRLFEYILIICTLLFAVGCVMAHPEIVSYNNFLMFVKDFNTSTVDTAYYTEIVYDTDRTEEISLYRGGVVVPGSDSVFVFTATGRLAYTDKHSFADPHLEVSDSVSLLYDFSSTSYSLYNSYMRVYKGESEHPIYACSLSDSGRYAFVLKKSDGKFGVAVYSEDNVRIAAFESDKYVISAALSKDGEKLAVFSLGVSEGERYSELKIYDCSDGSLLSQTKTERVQPLGCGFFEDGGVYALTDKKMIFIDSAFEMTSYREIKNASAVSLNGNYLAVRTSGALVVMNSSGEAVIEKNLPTDTVSFTVVDDTLFVLSGSYVTKTDILSGTEERTEIDKSYDRILATSKKHVILCGVSGASLTDFD